MFKSIWIGNFKGIYRLKLDLGAVNVLIGANASGKTSILQAIDFLINCVSRDVPEYLKDRGWKIEELRNQHKGELQGVGSQHKERTISFSCEIELDIDGMNEEIVWDIGFKTNLSEGTIWLYREVVGVVIAIDADITDPQNPKPMKRFKHIDLNDSGAEIYNSKSGVREPYPGFNRTSSFLKDINIEKQRDTYPVLARLKECIISCQSFEMLTPERIRHSSRGKVSTIGRGGEKLAAFIRQFQNGTKASFINKVNGIIPNTESITTSVRSRPGWVELILKEKFGDLLYATKSNHISDGMLRIIALAALTEMPQKEGMILLDEIEDGLNPQITTKIVELLKSYVQDTNRQILLTTHSVVMLIDFKPEEIQYVYRDAKGFVQVTKAYTDNDKIKEMLEYMNPGEIWLSSKESDFLPDTE